jgi:hypothetical protein
MSKSKLYKFDEAARLISEGRPYLAAGDEEMLRALPAGNWIGGTIPYFVTEEGPQASSTEVFLTELPRSARLVAAHLVGDENLAKIFTEVPANGWGVMILPSGCKLQETFALKAPTLPGFAIRPLVGWMAGTALSEIGARSPAVVNGLTKTFSSHEGVVMYLDLPPALGCEVSIVNLYRPGHGPDLCFPEPGFSPREVQVGGRRRNFGEYIREAGIDVRNPLVGDLGGASVNVSLQSIDEATGEVRLYSPVFKNVRYRFADAPDFLADWQKQLPPGGSDVVLAFNCILNYLRLQQEGIKKGCVPAPASFGEIAYQALNQTMVCLSVHDLRKKAG